MIKTTLLSLALSLTLMAFQSEEKIYSNLEEDPLFHAKRDSGLSLYEALERAIEQSPKVRAASEIIIQDRERVTEAEAGHLPSVNFSGDVGYELRQSAADPLYTGTPATTTINRYKKTDFYLTITQNLWSGGSIENSIDEKDANLKASLLSYRNILESLVVEAAKSYFTLVYAEIALKISEKNMKNYEKILNIVTIKEKNGAATKGDVNFIRANVDNAKTQLVQNEKNLADAIANYIYLLQIKDASEMPYEIASSLYIADMNESINAAESNNAALLTQRAYIKATKFGFLATKGNFHPTVDFAINGESRDEFDMGTGGQREKANALINFSYNLYNGGKDEATAIRLLAKMREQKYIYQDIYRKLRYDVEVLNSSVLSLAASLSLTQSEVLATREVVQSYWIGFQHGTQDLQALQLAQRNLNTAEQSYATYKRDLLINNFSLMQKTGVLLTFLELPYKREASEFSNDFSMFYEFEDLK